MLRAVEGGFVMPADYARAIFSFINEARAAEYVTLSPAQAGDIAPPGEAVLTAYVKAHPSSALAKLVHRGTSFTSAQTPVPSDSFPGMVAQVTGGNPRTTGAPLTRLARVDGRGSITYLFSRVVR